MTSDKVSEKRNKTQIYLALIICTSLIIWSLVCVLIGARYRKVIRSELPLAIRKHMISEAEREQMAFGRTSFRLQANHEQLASDIFIRSNIWFDHATRANDYHEYGEAVMAYRRILSRKPNDIYALQRLAKLHLTSKSKHARDPYEAFRLIFKANNQITYQKEDFYRPTPQILMTYAEAMFQLNEYDEAVRLMKLAMNYTREPHYRDKGIQQSKLNKYLKQIELN